MVTLSGKDDTASPDEADHPDETRFGGPELGPDSGVYFIEQLLSADTSGPQGGGASTESQLVAEGAGPSSTQTAGADAEPENGAHQEQAATVPRTWRSPADGRRSSLNARLVVVLAVLLVATVGLGTAVALRAKQMGEAAYREAERFSTSQPAGLRIVVIGDESVEHSSAASGAASQWPALLREDLDGQQVELLDSAGSGYVTAGASGSTFVTAAAQVPRDAGVIVMFGGAADRASAPLRVLKAATQAFSMAAQRAPKARIIAVGPLSGRGVTAKNTEDLRRILRASATTAGISWADPIAGAWLAASLPNGPRPGDERKVADRVRSLLLAPQSSSP